MTINISWPQTDNHYISTVNDLSNPLSSIPSVHYMHAMSSQSQTYQQNPYHHNYPANYPVDSVSWNGVLRLLLLSVVSTIGSMGGIFVISAITVIDTFQVRGNCYLVSLAFGHLMVTVLVVPASAVAIMAGVPDDTNICHFQWLTTLACLIVSVLSFMFMAIDNFFGFGSIVTYDLCCTKCRIVFIVALIWTVAIVFPISQHLNNFGPEFCKDKRSSKIWIDFHPYVLGMN